MTVALLSPSSAEHEAFLTLSVCLHVHVQTIVVALVKAKRRRIDFAMASPSVAALVRGARVETDDGSVGRWSDHYPLLIDLAQP